MSRKNEPQMLEHSLAKVDLYGRYLSIYLNILHRTPYIDQIYLFDLLCGEGLYNDDAKGSPIIALEVIKEHFNSNKPPITPVTIWFNDNGLSDIERGSFKIERVERLVADLSLPTEIEIKYFRNDFADIYQRAYQTVEHDKRSKGLFFIDPYGYKVVRPHHIEEILRGGDIEIILFMPASHMYRFAESTFKHQFPGSEPLRQFLYELYKTKSIRFSSTQDFIDQTKLKFREYLGGNDIFVDTFILERDSSNIYCLFFFTSHIRGFQKMLETKWQMDESQGRGFKLGITLPLFKGVEGSDYPDTLRSFMLSADYRTNEDLYKFGLENGFLPKHTLQILRKWENEPNRLEKFALDNDTTPIRGYYISYRPKRRIGLRLKQ